MRKIFLLVQNRKKVHDISIGVFYLHQPREDGDPDPLDVGVAPVQGGISREEGRSVVTTGCALRSTRLGSYVRRVRVKSDPLALTLGVLLRDSTTTVL